MANAIIRQTIGYSDTAERAFEHIETLKKDGKPYVGWDKQTYPQYEISIVKKIQGGTQ